MRKQPKKPSKDELWKTIIETFFEAFMYHYFPHHAPNIDFARGYVFLNQELQAIAPDSDSKDRRADRLVKVWLKNGDEHWILIHIEVQGYVDEDFDLRVYNSHYRIRDRYNRPVGVFIVYTDDSPSYHPQEFREECLGTLSLLQFPTYKLLDHPPETQKDSDNIFSLISEVAWYEMKKDKLNDENYLKIGRKIVRKLARGGYDRETIIDAMRFIQYYVPFENQENFNKFKTDIRIIFKKEKNMSITELIRKYEKENIMEEGKEISLV